MEVVAGLWLVADGDPQDPPANLAGVPAQQPNSRIVVMPAQQHVIGHLGCMPSIIAAFLEAGSANQLDTVVRHAGGAGPAFPSGVSLNPPMFSFVTAEVGHGPQPSTGGIRVMPVRDLPRRQASNQPAHVDIDTSGASPV